MPRFNVIGSIFHHSESKPNHASNYYSAKENVSGKGHKGKLSKSDIGTPTNFKHITHLGFDGMSGIDGDSNLKRLLDLAGIQDEQLKNNDVSHKLFDIIEKEGGIGAVQKMTRRMTSVEKPNVRTRLRSLSSSSVSQAKLQNIPTESPLHATKIPVILPDGSSFNYLPSQSKVVLPLSTPKNLNRVHSNPPSTPLPPYLGELSRIISPATNHPVHPVSRNVPPLPPRPQFIKDFKQSSNKATSNLTNTVPPSAVKTNAVPPSAVKTIVPVCPEVAPFTQVAKDCLPSHFPPSVPTNESSLPKSGDVPALLPKSGDVPALLPKSGDVPPLLLPVSSLKAKSLPLCPEPFPSKVLDNGTAPPAPPLPHTNQATNIGPRGCSSKRRLNSSDDEENAACRSDHKELTADSEAVNEPSLFLDQIRQGVQLKTVGQTVKSETAENGNFVSVLRDAMQKRHKAIHSSDEEDNNEEEEWED